MKIAVGADHAGYILKNPVIKKLKALGHEVIDVGAMSYDPNDDYPDYALALSEQVASDAVSRGVMLCGSGVGASVTCNKIRGIRASVCHDTYSAHQGVEHDDMNVLCMGSRIVGEDLAKELVEAFVSAIFSGEKRHARRLGKILEAERRWNKE